VNATLIKHVLHDTAELLVDGGFEEGLLEAEVLLAEVLGISRTELFLLRETTLSTDQTKRLDHLIWRRLNHEPIAYITGHKEFFGIDFIVSRDTLIPRPETELLVEKALELAASRVPTIESIADIGTGCGAIAVALAVHLSAVKVYAIDISASALETATVNARSHGVAERVDFLRGDLLQPLPEPVDIILANLPYVSGREMETLSEDVRLYEPEMALAGGPEGLDQIDRLLAQAGEKLRSGGAVLLEIGYEQGPDVADLAKRYFPQAEIEIVSDLSGNDRVVVVDMGVRDQG